MGTSQPTAPAGEGSVVDRFQSLIDADALSGDPPQDDPDSGKPPASAKPAKPAAPAEEDEPEHPEDDDLPPAESDDEPEDGGEEQPEDDEDEEPAPATGEVILTLDGKPVKLTNAEASAGYLRQQDYTRKTQEVAEKERATVAEAEQLRAARLAYTDRLTALDAMLAEDDGITEEQLAALRTKNPAEYSAIITERGQREREREKITREKNRVLEEQALADRDALRKHIQSEQVLLATAIPEWADAKVRQAEQRRLVEFGQKLGFSPQELQGVTDHRAILTLRKAMLHDELTSKQTKLRKGAPPAIPLTKSGAKAPAGGAPAAAGGATRKIARAKAELRKTGGSKQAAMAAFDAILEGQGEKN